MLSGASMPSDEIMVAQLGPRPLLGGAILARPRGWGATVRGVFTWNTTRPLSARDRTPHGC